MADQSIPKTKRICQVKECGKKHYAKGFCKRHYRQDRYDGHIHRTRNDPNDFIVEGDVCKIIIYDKFCDYKHTALIDTEDLPLVENHKWMSALTVQNIWYVRTSINRKIVPIHRIIMAHLLDDTIEVDHINFDTFDNRKVNLRVCTRSQNMMNKKITTNNTSGYKGVSFNKDMQKWTASLRIKGEFIYLGLHDTAIEAAEAYNIAAKKHCGEFAYLNRIDEIKTIGKGQLFW